MFSKGKIAACLLLLLASLHLTLLLSQTRKLALWFPEDPRHAEHVPLDHSRRRIPLPELTGSSNLRVVCPGNHTRQDDVVLDSRLAFAGGRNIPRIVHMTAKSRCLAPEFKELTDKWKFPEYSVFFHDDQAVDRLLSKRYSEFPHLEKAITCLSPLSGAAKADLWRALLMWEYGGIYTDFDSVPNKFNGTTIQASDEAFFIVENFGIASQYFFAAAPRHPLFYMLVQTILTRLFAVENVDQQYVPVVTGPHALRDALAHFMFAHDLKRRNLERKEEGLGPLNDWQQVTEGVHTGFQNRTVTILGNRKNSDEYILRMGMGPKKKEQIYEEMGMTHFYNAVKNKKSSLNYETCLHRLYKKEPLEDYRADVENPVLW